MSGYTPVFGSVFTGTLCGKYPDTAAWLFLLALADKNGVVDMTPAYISSVTGMPEDELLGCIERFMEPDPYSRTTEHDGRRLIPLDPERPWGWKVVNHGKYREKARLQAKNAREVADGNNAKRLASRRAETADDRRRPPDTAADPLSNANTNLKKDSPSESPKKARSRAPAFNPPSVDEVRAYCRERGNAIDPEAFVDFYTGKGWMVGRNRMKDWRAAVRTWEKRHAEDRQRGRVGAKETTREFAERMARYAEGCPG